MDYCFDMLSKCNDTYEMLSICLHCSASRKDPVDQAAILKAYEKYKFESVHMFSILAGFACTSLGVEFGSGKAEDRKVETNELAVRPISRTSVGLEIGPNKSPITLTHDVKRTRATVNSLTSP